MARGIIYVMTTVVPGLIKIGKTGIDNFESRMYQLEHNGYFNVVGLKRRFAIEVDRYDEKERLLDEIFSKSQVPNSELFALDVDLVVQLLSSFEGKQIYPQTGSKDEMFKVATEEHQVKVNMSKVPDGEYYYSGNIKGYGKVTATMYVEEGTFIVKKGSMCLPAKADDVPAARKNALIENGILLQDVETNSPSTAGSVVLGHAVNGWTFWKDDESRSIDFYRKN